MEHVPTTMAGPKKDPWKQNHGTATAPMEHSINQMKELTHKTCGVSEHGPIHLANIGQIYGHGLWKTKQQHHN